jgi:magnesium transporter
MTSYTINPDLVFTVLSFEDADTLSYDLSQHPIQHHYHELKLNFLEISNDIIGPLYLLYGKNELTLICDDPTLYLTDLEDLVENEEEDFNNALLVYVAGVNFEALSLLEETIVTMSNNLAQGRAVSLQNINDIKSKCLEFSKNSRRNVFATETHPELNNQHLTVLTQSIYQYAQHLLDLAQHLLDTYSNTSQERNNAILNRLTLVTLFTTPYTLLAGLYGMNVGNLPLALHPYGHLIILAIMSFSSLLIYVLLKYKKVL